MHITFVFAYNINGYLRIESGSYHARDGLKRDVGYAVPPGNQTENRRYLGISYFLIYGIKLPLVIEFFNLTSDIGNIVLNNKFPLPFNTCIPTKEVSFNRLIY